VIQVKEVLASPKVEREFNKFGLKRRHSAQNNPDPTRQWFLFKYRIIIAIVKYASKLLY
jgi:hypothetical protein